MGKKVHENFLMGLKIWWSWGSRFFFSKSPIVGRFLVFRPKLQFFAGLGAFLGELFCQFFVIFSCKISVFCEAGRYFWVKKYIYFPEKLQILRGWMVFFSKKTTLFWDFLEICGAGCFFGELFCQFFAIFVKCPRTSGGRAREAREANPRCWQPVHPSRWAQGTILCATSLFQSSLKRNSSLRHEPLSLFAADLLLPWSSVARYEVRLPQVDRR